MNGIQNINHLMMMMKVLMMENRLLILDVHVLLYQFVYANNKHLVHLRNLFFSLIFIFKSLKFYLQNVPNLMEDLYHQPSKINIL